MQKQVRVLESSNEHTLHKSSYSNSQMTPSRLYFFRDDPHFSVYKFGCQGDKKFGPLILRTPQCVFENRSQTASKNKTEGSSVFYLYPTHSVTQWGTATLV